MFEPSGLEWNRRIGTLLNLWPVTESDDWRPVGGWQVADAPWRVGWPAFWLEPVFRSAERRYIGRSLIKLSGSPTWQIGEASGVRTIGSDRIVGAGAILIWGVLATPTMWKTWREHWEEIRPGLVGLDRALGGDGALQALDALIADPDVAALFATNDTDTERASKLFTDIATRVDPEPAHVAYRALVHASITGSSLPPAPAGGYGPWARGAALLRFAEAVRGRRAASATDDAWQMLSLGGGTDFQHLRLIHHLALRPDNGPSALRAAARAMVNPTALADSVKHPLRVRLPEVADTQPYDGVAHLEAARELRALGRQREALALLADAAICAAPLGSPVLRDVFNAASGFGREAGLDRLAERAQTLAEAVR